MYLLKIHDMSLPMTKESLLKNKKTREDGQSSSTFVLPSDVEELPASILRLHTKFFNNLSFMDGLCGSFLPVTKEYIMSPNSDYIPSPPLGSTRNLYCQSDACYGDDDPICWPQPFNMNYPWYSAITRKPKSLTSLATFIMGLIHAKRKEGVVRNELTTKLESRIEALKRRSLSWHQTNRDNFRHKFVKEHMDTIDLCLTCLKNVSALIRAQQLALTELQQGFLTVQAVLDYTDYETRVITSDVPLSFQSNKIGAFVWNNRDACTLFNAGLPPKLPEVPMGPADPPYHTITMGQAGSDDKFSALCQASIQCFNTISPFQNLHIPGAYASSYQLGNGRIMAPALSPSSHIQPSSQLSSPHHGQQQSHSQRSQNPRKPRKPNTNSPTVQRDTFADLPPDNPLVPPAISAWEDANKTINQNGVLPGKRSSAVPNPGLFFSLQHLDRQSPYLSMWQHFRAPWLAALESGRSPLTVELWRKILAYAYLQPIEAGQVISPKMQVTVEAKKLVCDVILFYDSRMTLTPASSTSAFDPATACKLICELCMINFCSEVLYVDQVLDTSQPVPQ
ncbi:hypothetical protein BT96DRAFT_1002520 [Gymnopus androsaceus JB14]|uniref:Uncharacterized protein n=1 Tax=Gymnopus androsaceus JB14 TaxID=1447944 RepID=A0A6A4GWQ5_9AGAR|nr:hypothetical protein BT96DRAFT_1002520 [Gymnopus androsaceus JB14]